MAAGGLSAGDRCGAAEARERGLALEAADVAGLRDQGGGDQRAGAVQIGDWVAVLGEQLGDLGVEFADASVEVLDVARELADATGGGCLREAVAEAEALE